MPKITMKPLPLYDHEAIYAYQLLHLRPALPVRGGAEGVS